MAYLPHAAIQTGIVFLYTLILCNLLQEGTNIQAIQEG
jgi:hypothetical protein